MYTYLMFDERTKYHKIGKSQDPKYREKTLQSDNPLVVLVWKIKGDIEKQLHQRYDNKRVRGEWFNLSENEIENIKNIDDMINNNVFIGVKKACKLTGKSQPTLSIFCRDNVNSKYIKKDGKAYLINKDFLLKTYPAINHLNINSMNLDNEFKNENANKDSLIQSLQEQLTAKDNQIMKLIDLLSKTS